MDLSLYRRYAIRKRGSRRLRIIHAPVPALKEKQKMALWNEYLGRIGPGPYACAFVRHRGIARHAKAHVEKAYVVRIDISDFFHSVRKHHIVEAWAFERLTPAELETRCQSLTLENWERAPIPRGLLDLAFIPSPTDFTEECLPQGSPLSGYLANLALKKMDFVITKIMKLKFGYFGYSRYADDLVLSANDKRIIRFAMFVVPKLLRTHGFEVNWGKFQVMRRSQRQSVCGIVVNGSAPAIPREKRHEIRGRVHHLYMDALSGKEIDREELLYVTGFLAYAQSINKEWVKKFDDQMKVIRLILSAREKKKVSS